jgi:hypothetical protein
MPIDTSHAPTAEGTPRPATWLKYFGIFCVWTCVAAASETGRPISKVEIQVEAEPGMLQRYAVLGGRVEGNVSDSAAYVEMEKVAVVTGLARFYGEFFDDRGRRCFTLVFSSAFPRQRLGPEWPAGQRRVLISQALNLGPAARPARLSLQELPSPYASRVDQGMAVDAPPIISGGNAKLPWQRIELDSEIAAATGPVLDLVLARVAIDDKGVLEDVQLVYSISPGCTKWFLELIRHLTWNPALRAGRPAADQTLLLARAALTPTGMQAHPSPTWESAAVQRYANDLPGPDLPAVNEIVVEPPDFKYPDQPTPGPFEYLGLPTTWSMGPLEEGRWRGEPTSAPARP